MKMAMVVARTLMGCSPSARGCAPSGLWPPLRLLQGAVLRDGSLASKLNALTRHPNLVAAGLAGAAGQTQLVLLDAPGAGARLAERERRRTPVPAEDRAP